MLARSEARRAMIGRIGDTTGKENALPDDSTPVSCKHKGEERNRHGPLLLICIALLHSSVTARPLPAASNQVNLSA